MATAAPTVDVIAEMLAGEREALDRFRVKTLSVFGSVARGEASRDSDVDFLVEFDGDPGFREYMGLLFFLEDSLGRHVDLATPRIAEAADQRACAPRCTRRRRYAARCW